MNDGKGIAGRQGRGLTKNRGLCFALISAILLLPFAAPAIAQMDEYSIKAGYLYNFSKYVDWPDGAVGAKFVFCIVGDDPFAGKLDQTIAGKTTRDGKPMEVRKIGAEEVKSCQIAFVSRAEKRHIAAILIATKGATVMTVADFSPFAESGGVAGFRLEDNKVKVDLNMDAANRAALKVSSKLQQVANLVSGGG